MARFQGTIRNDIIRGTRDADRVEGKAGDDLIYGLAGNDLLKGDEGNDTIYGGIGNDNVQGDAGDDKLFGEAGNDILEGGLGNDRLSGGTGADIFVFGDPATGRDVILDFTDGVDRIEFDLDTVNSFNDLSVRQLTNGSSLVSWDGGSVVLVDIPAISITASDFMF